MSSGRFKDYEFETLEIHGTNTWIKESDKEYLKYLFDNQMYDEFFQFCLIKDYNVLFDKDVLFVAHVMERELIF